MAELTLTGLRVVVEVARSGSLSAAALSLGYTQSAVSRQVATSERAAGAPLFERHPRGVTPTPAGDVLLKHAARVLDTMTAAGQELAGLRDRLVGRLVVGGFPTAAATLLPRTIAAVVAEHPALDVSLFEGSTPRQLQALRRGRTEVAIIAAGEGLPDYDLDGLRLTELHGRGAGVAVAAGHPLAARDVVDAHDLAGQRWVAGRGEGPEFGAWPGLEQPTIAFTAHDWPTRLGLVEAGLGIALVPGFAARSVPQGVRWLAVRPWLTLDRHTYAATAAHPSPAAATMVETAQRVAETV